MRGVSLIEVLVTMVILAVGLLGLAGLQIRLQSSELESYQRTQALILLEDMTNRISTNRANAAAYVTTAANPLGIGDSQPISCSGNGQSYDVCQWSNALKGAAEQSSDSINCGAGLYDSVTETKCINDLCRRSMSTIVRIANLASP